MSIDCCKAFAILVVVCLVYEIYRHKYPVIGIKKWFAGIRDNYNMHRETNKKRDVKNAFPISAGFVRESLIALCAIVAALWILGCIFNICNLPIVTEYIINNMHDNLTAKYPLLTTIVGAFIALLCDYFVVYPKMYVSPNAFFTIQKKDKKDCNGQNGETEEVLKWYIENRSLFDSIDIHVEAYKCTCFNQKGDIRMEPVEMRVSNISTMAGRWATNHDNAITITAKDVKKEDILSDEFDYIELVVKVTHALSRVTKVITQQYYKADFYNGVMEQEKLYSGPKNKPRAEILTLKAGVQKRFMYARKFAGYSITAIILIMLAKMVFETNETLLLSSILNVLLVSNCILLIIFSILRVIYKMSVYTDDKNDNYVYRVVYKE